MSWIPPDWETSRASGYGEFHYLTHTPCGWRSHNFYDLVWSGAIMGPQQAKNVVSRHTCYEED